MQKGTKVKALSDHSVHPLARAREGIVQGPGVCGTVSVLFEDSTKPLDVDESVLEIVAPPAPEEVPLAAE